MYRRLLVAFDGSEIAHAAVAHARITARAAGAELLLLTAVESATDRPSAERALEAIAADLRTAGLEAVRATVVDGSASSQIIAVARDQVCDLVVMATHGRSGFKRMALGSVADEVIRQGDGLSVLLVRSAPVDGERPYRQIVLTHDGSALSTAAASNAAHMVEVHGATLVLLRAINSVDQWIESTATGELGPTLTAVQAAERVAEERIEAEASLTELAAQLRGLGVTAADRRVTEGHPVESIVSVVDELHADLVVMSTHGRGGLGRALLGSVTDQVVRRIETAVLVVHPRDG